MQIRPQPIMLKFLYTFEQCSKKTPITFNIVLIISSMPANSYIFNEQTTLLEFIHTGFIRLLYTGNFGGVKFWQIATVEANGEENFGGSNGRSSVVSVSL